MNCYACANEATSQCHRCGRLYCDEHGDALCAECLKPSSALPSYTLYRGSLLALLVGSAFAIWLAGRPGSRPACCRGRGSGGGDANASPCPYQYAQPAPYPHASGHRYSQRCYRVHSPGRRYAVRYR